MDAQIAERLNNHLASKGLRRTRQREVIVDTVFSSDEHFNAEELLDRVRAVDRTVSRATVYRTLTHLQDAGILRQVFFDNKKSHYEVVAGRQAYDHLICITSGRVIEFSSDKLKALRDEICAEHGWDPVSHQFQIFAVSPDAKAPTPPR